MLPAPASSGAALVAARDDIGAWFVLHESIESCAMQR